MTLGNAKDFGDLSSARRTGGKGQSCNATRMIFYGGLTPTYVNVISYITIATKGNDTDFGDAPAPIGYCAAMASPTRCVFAGGDTTGDTSINTISSIEILTTGNAVDFGDTTLAARSGVVGASNGHGGL